MVLSSARATLGNGGIHGRGCSAEVPRRLVKLAETADTSWGPAGYDSLLAQD